MANKLLNSFLGTVQAPWKYFNFDQEFDLRTLQFNYHSNSSVIKELDTELRCS